MALVQDGGSGGPGPGPAPRPQPRLLAPPTASSQGSIRVVVLAVGERASAIRHGGSGGDCSAQGEWGRRSQRRAEEEGLGAFDHGVPSYLQCSDDSGVRLGLGEAGNEPGW